MVNITRLWNDAKFNTLDNDAKLLYIYLCTNPNINNVGVICQQPELISNILNINIDKLRMCTMQLVKKKYIYVEGASGFVYFIVPKHFSTISKSDLMVEKIKSDLKSLPKSVIKFLDSIGINVKAKVKFFRKPTEKEVLDYAISQGHMVNAKEFIEFYDNIAKNKGHTDGRWVDSRNKIVRDWKGKLRKVWFKPENKLEIAKDTPKGMETFGVEINGTLVMPDYWKDGKPRSKDFATDLALQKEFKKQYE